MAYYTREEQETVYRFDPIDKRWHVYSTYPPHIKRILERVDDVKTDKDDKRRVVYVEATILPHQIRLYK